VPVQTLNLVRVIQRVIKRIDGEQTQVKMVQNESRNTNESAQYHDRTDKVLYAKKMKGVVVFSKINTPISMTSNKFVKIKPVLRFSLHICHSTAKLKD
jgi:aconitase A